jgi:hypothetical protein
MYSETDTEPQTGLGEATYAEVLQPRGREGRWIMKPGDRDLPARAPSSAL